MTLSIIIPVYNEETTISIVVKKVLKIKLPNGIAKEIIIVNDGSNDGTSKMLSAFKLNPLISQINHSVRKGKTEAVKTGFKHSTGELIIIQDADLEYDPCQYPQLLDPILNQNKSVVYGSRFMGNTKKMHFINLFANKTAVLTCNILFGTNLTDFHTCFKMFRKELLNDIEICSSNFSFDTELTAKFLKKEIEIYEVPIDYVARTKSQGKKITWGQAIESYVVLFKCRFEKASQLQI